MSINDKLLRLIEQRKGTPTGQPEVQSIGRPRQYGPPEPVSSYAPKEYDPSQIDVNNFIGGWQESEYNKQFGANQDWLTENPVKGPGGEDIPYGAVGFDWYGRPYYGDGLTGWLNGFISKINAPIEKEARDETLVRKEVPFHVPGLAMKPEGAPETSEGIDYGATIENLAQGTAGSPVAYGVRAGQETVKGVIDVFSESARKAEQGLAVAGDLATTASAEALQTPERNLSYRQYVPEEELQRQADEWVEYFKNRPTTVSDWFNESYDTEIKYGQPHLKLVEGGPADAAYQAGRILYSSFNNIALREEFIRRYRGGENPYLLAQELENPYYEMIGQVIIDPLNLLGLGAKSVRDTSRGWKVRNAFFDLPPELDDMLKAAKGASPWDVTDVKVAENLGDFVQAQINVNQATRQGLTDLAKETGLFSLTAEGKRWNVGKRSGELSAWVINSLAEQDPDKSMEIFKALAQIASDDADEVATGMAVLAGQSVPRPLFSQAGQELGVVLRNMLTDSDGALRGSEFLEELEKAEDIEKIIKAFDKRGGAVIDGMFPSLQERIKNGEKVSWATRALVKADARIQKSVYIPLNTFFSGVYMGLSPGYAFRNLFTNSFHVLIDEGPGALASWSLPRLARNTKLWLEGTLPQGWGGFGGGTGGVDIVESWRKSKALPGFKAGELGEQVGAAQTIAHSVEQTMKRMVQPGRALPDLTYLTEKGFSPKDARYLSDLVLENFADVDKAMAQFAKDAKAGSVDIYRTLEWLSDDSKTKLSDFKLLDEIEDITKNAENLDDAKSRIGALKVELKDEAAKVVDDVPVVNSTSEMIEDAEAMGEAHRLKDIDQESYAVAASYIQANEISNDSWRKVINELRWDFEGNPNLRTFRAWLDGDIAKVTADLTRNRRNTVIKLREASFSTDPEVFNMAKVWKELGLEGPVPINRLEFRRALWEDFYFPFVREKWDAYRDGYANVGEQLVSLLNPEDTVMIDEARKQFAGAQLHSQTLRQDQIRLPLTRAKDLGDTAGANRILAHQYGIGTQLVDEAGEAGAHTDKRLVSLVKKYLPGEYDEATDLAQIDPDDMKRALDLRIQSKAEEAVAAAPPPQAAEAPPAAVPEQAAEAITVTPTRKTTALGSDPTVTYEFEYEVVDLDQLIPSHTDELARNPQFPEELQPRVRDRKASQLQIDRIANELEPDALLVDTHRLDSGPMIVGEDLVVESGNGRILGLRRARSTYPDKLQNYVDELRAALPQYGLSEADLEGITTPVLVRKRTTDVDRVKFAAEANQSTTLRMAPFEQALQDADILTDSLVASLRVGETQSIDQALNSTNNRNIVREFLKGLPENEQAVLIDANGVLNRTGLERIKSAFFAKTYPGEAGERLLAAFIESIDPGIKNFENAMYASLQDMSRAEGLVKSGNRPANLSISDDISKTVDVYARLKQNGISIEDYFTQYNLFGQELDDFQRALLGYISENARSPKKLREMLQGYARAVIEQEPLPPVNLFGEETVTITKGELLQDVINSIEKDELPLFAGTETGRPAQIPGGEAPAVTIPEEVAPAPQISQGLEEPAAGGAARPVVEPPPPPPKPPADNTPSFPRMITEQLDGAGPDKPGINQLLDSVQAELEAVWGQSRPVTKYRQGDLNEWAKIAKTRIKEARLVAANVANAARDFTMLSYPEKRTFDLALAYVFPYHFWYNRTYANWMKRLAYNPEIIAGYAKYKDTLSKIHAGAPEWWKYNINSNELLGLDSENPLFFNFEATLNPLNGLVGIDFNDPRKRMNWWTKTLDDIGKFGPSTWTPFSIATATALYMRGEEDAAARWGGRLVPQTATLKSLLSLANINIKTGEGINEFDPAVLWFSRGLDPYERSRTGRSIGTMIEEGKISQAQGTDAAKFQEGDIWSEGIERSIRQRRWGQLASFFLGVGFKSRNVSDMQIDRMDQEWRRLWAMADTLSPDEIRDRMDDMRERYPFMDTVLLSRKAGLDRDRSYAYNVLGRIPPGQKDDIAEVVGIKRELFDRFYEDKGNLTEWAETDRQRFMAGMVDIGSLLDMPDDATRAEWNQARDLYSDLQTAVGKIFGDDIQTKIDGYYSTEYEQRDAYLEQHPEVADAMDWQQSSIMNDPRLSQYYNSIDKIERYYRGLMYDSIRIELGADIWDKWDEYYTQKLIGSKEGKAYWNAHPELERYVEAKSKYEEITAGASVRVADSLREVTYPNLRPEADIASLGQQDLFAQLGEREPTAYDYTWEDWRGLMSQPLERLVIDYVDGGEELSRAAEDQLEYIAGDIGVDYNIMLELIERSRMQMVY